MSAGPINQEEEIQESPFQLRLTIRLVSYLGAYKGRVAFALALILVAAVSSQIGPRLTQIGVDDYIVKGDLAGLHWIIFAFFASIVVQYIAQYGQTLVTEMTGQYVMRDMRRQIFVHLQRLPMRYFDRTPVGRTMTRTTNDVESLNEFFTEGVVSVFMDFLTLVAIVVFMADMDPRLTLVTCTVIPVLAVATFYLQGKAVKAYRELRLRLARINSYLQENISGMEVVQLFSRETRNLREFDDEHLPYRRAEEREIGYFAVFFPFTEFVSAVGMALVIWYGAGAVIQSRIELGVLVAFLQYVRRFFRPIMDLSDRYALMQSAMAASERIFELLDTPAEPAGGSGLHEVVTAATKAIDFDGVHFKYDPAGDYVLEDVSFSVESGESLAIVGATGSGKTTVVNLLCRFYDVQEGSIKVDGRDVREWPLEDLRRRFGIVQQDVFLFSGDIESNISLQERDISSEQVRAAARNVNADRFIERLPRRFQQPVAEGGVTLSSGQRQLLSFARALAFDPEILVLDEATANIDTETEHLIQDAIGKLMRDRTSIVIAHRLSTIRSADHIIVLHRGQIRERGRHEELIQIDGIYARLYRLHLSGQE
ncbi:MAG: ABC transporter ATP-binding protein [Candidatus Latescibacterota bacterium]|nr:ABC transporter ATP-binding protein [Candidatus Latescibacterota bacterium]